jgi:hypothetical protein
MLLLILLIALACWCWLGTGPLLFRWPLVVLLVLLTSGHQMGAVVGSYLETFAEPILTLGIVFLGLWIMVRGFGGRRRTEHDYHHRRGWHGHRW